MRPASRRTLRSHCQSGKKPLNLRGSAADRIVDARPLHRARELGAKALPQLSERRVERQRARNRACRVPRLPGPLEALPSVVEDQDLVLDLADQIVPDVELEQAVAEQRMLDGRPEFPGALRLEVGVAAGDAVAPTDRRR